MFCLSLDCFCFRTLYIDKQNQNLFTHTINMLWKQLIEQVDLHVLEICSQANFRIK